MASALNLTKEGRSVYLTDYEPRSVVRLLVVTSLVAGIITALALTGQFSHLSQWLLPSNLWKPLTCGGIGLILLSSTTLIIYKAKKGLASGKVIGSSHWKKCLVKTHLSNTQFYEDEQHIDISTLDEQGTGIARLYFKQPRDAVLTGVFSAILMPIYVLAVMVYNLFRLIIIPFYIIIQIIRENNINIALYPDERKFSFGDIPKQMILSIGRIIQAPFYGVAMFFSSLYTLIDPLNAIKLGASIEHCWNGQIPMRNSGVWMICCTAFKDWQWEGGGGPQKLGQNGFYFAGSWLAHRDIKCNDWQITEIIGVNGAETETEGTIDLSTSL